MTEQEIIDLINEAYDNAIGQIPGMQYALVNFCLDSTPIPQAMYDARAALNVLRQAELDNINMDARLGSNQNSAKK